MSHAFGGDQAPYLGRVHRTQAYVASPEAGNGLGWPNTSYFGIGSGPRSLFLPRGRDRIVVYEVPKSRGRRSPRSYWVSEVTGQQRAITSRLPSGE
jgi:hypothetical protein